MGNLWNGAKILMTQKMNTDTSIIYLDFTPAQLFRQVLHLI